MLRRDTNSTPATTLVLLSELGGVAIGGKVRFVGCVQTHNIPANTFTLATSFPHPRLRPRPPVSTRPESNREQSQQPEQRIFSDSDSDSDAASTDETEDNHEEDAQPLQTVNNTSATPPPPPPPREHPHQPQPQQQGQRQKQDYVPAATRLAHVSAPLLTSAHPRPGDWISVIGYRARSPVESDGGGVVYVQALLVSPANSRLLMMGPEGVRRYERSVEGRRGGVQVRDVGEDGDGD